MLSDIMPDLLRTLLRWKIYKHWNKNLQEVLSRSSTSDLVVNWKCMRTWPLFRGLINNSSLKVSSLPFDDCQNSEKSNWATQMSPAFHGRRHLEKSEKFVIGWNQFLKHAAYKTKMIAVMVKVINIILFINKLFIIYQVIYAPSHQTAWQNNGSRHNTKLKTEI